MRAEACWFVCRRGVGTFASGVFFVRKKNGFLGLILDARRGNRRFRVPPSKDLLTGEGLIRVEMTVNDLRG